MLDARSSSNSRKAIEKQVLDAIEGRPGVRGVITTNSREFELGNAF